MKRRSFLKSLFAVPFVPGFLKDWVPEDIREGVEEELTRAAYPLRGDPVLAAAVGNPLAITVVIPEGQRIKLTGIMHVVSAHNAVRPATVFLQEAGIKTEGTLNGGVLALAQYTAVHPQDLRCDVILEPTPGAHTYKLVASEGAFHDPWLSIIKAEAWP